MTKKQWKITGGLILGLGACAGVTLAVHFGMRDDTGVGQRRAQVQPATPLPPQGVTLNNAVTIQEAEDTRRTREYAFAKVKERFEAEGVGLDGAGQVTVRSQATDGTVKQQLVSAQVVRANGSKVKDLARNDEPVAEAVTTDAYGSVTYRDLFNGLDVEYRYDGKDVEELITINDELQKELLKAGAGLRISSLFPGVRTSEGALLEGAGMFPPGDPAAVGQAQTSTERVELMTAGGHRFVLPKGIAYDAAEQKTVLARTFDWTDEGLAVHVDVPAGWLQQTRGRVTIDPAIIDGPNSINALTWPGTRNIVKDANGLLHVVYTAVVNGSWRAMYATGDGTNWTTRGTIAPFGPCEYVQYQPSLVIDSRGTLHVVWSDYATGACPVERQTTNYRHKIHYAYCEDQCLSGNWQGGDFVYLAGDNHNYNYSLAVGGDDVLHLAFYNGDGNIRYMYNNNDGTEWVNAGIIQTGAYYPAVTVDSQNQPHIIAVYYYCYTGAATYHLYHDNGTNNWIRLPALDPLDGDNAYCFWPSIAVDSNDHLHVAMQLRDINTGAYRVAYGRWDGAAWQDRGLVDSSPYAFYEHNPAIAIDNNNTVHVVWQEEFIPSKIRYAQKTAGLGAPWSATVDLLPEAPGQIHANLRWSRFPDFNRDMVPNVIDVVYVEDWAYLSFLSTGAPVEGVQALKPLDHTYLSNTAPTFEWRRIGSDNGTNTTYSLEIAPTPLFITPLLPDKSGLTTSQYTMGGAAPDVLENGKYYYWRVRASNTFGPGPYGPIYELGVDTEAPSPFNLLTPADGSDPGTQTPTFEWEESFD